MRKLGYFVFGSLIGGLIGAAIALLFTPAPGSELRTNIKTYTLKTVDEVRQAALQRRDELEQQLANLRTGASTKLE